MSTRAWQWICEQHPDRPFPHEECAGPGMLPTCRWFAGCGREATGGTLAHPILGEVPVCSRCRAFVEAVS